jgi:hypothetical protein
LVLSIAPLIVTHVPAQAAGAPFDGQTSVSDGCDDITGFGSRGQSASVDPNTGEVSVDIHASDASPVHAGIVAGQCVGFVRQFADGFVTRSVTLDPGHYRVEAKFAHLSGSTTTVGNGGGGAGPAVGAITPPFAAPGYSDVVIIPDNTSINNGTADLFYDFDLTTQFTVTLVAGLGGLVQAPAPSPPGSIPTLTGFGSSQAHLQGVVVDLVVVSR